MAKLGALVIFMLAFCGSDERQFSDSPATRASPIAAGRRHIARVFAGEVAYLTTVTY